MNKAATQSQPDLTQLPPGGAPLQGNHPPLSNHNMFGSGNFNSPFGMMFGSAPGGGMHNHQH